MDVYDQMAEFYDLIYSDSLDLEFYLQEAKNARGPVLEVACGTGRILLRLAKEGIDVTGLDISQGMLAILEKKAKEAGIRAKTHVADMASFRLQRQFSLIIVPYRSFLHLRSDEQRKKALGTFYEHLMPGGRLILHTYNPSEQEKALQGGYHNYEREEVTDPAGRKRALHWYLQYEPRGRVGHYKIIMKADGEKDREFLMDIAFVGEKDMEALLKGAGYRNIKRYCGFSYSPYNESCKEVVWIAER